MATFALGDALLKIISLSLPVSQILIITGFAGGVISLSIICITKTRLFMPELGNMVFLPHESEATSQNHHSASDASFTFVCL